MRKLTPFALAAAAVALLPAPALAGGSHHGGMVTHMPPAGGTSVHRWGHRMNGRWYAGWYAPGGWTSYRRPAYGYVLPRYWIQPTYYIGNYWSYGLPAPAYGYGWSRYYDDAVLTDRYGRVIDSRQGMAWDRYDGGYDGDYPYEEDGAYYRERRDSGLGGAAIGAVAGGIAGNLIAGKGHRTEGTLIGAGVGAIAGYAVDKAEDAPARDRWKDRDRPHRDDGVTYNNEYDGQWSGTWKMDDGRTYSGTFDGTYRGTAPDPAPELVRGPPPGYGHPHWMDGADGAAMPPMPGTPAYPYAPAGYIANGFYYPAPTVTTVIVEPGTTTTTTYVEERVVTRKPARHKWKPRTKSCTCN